MYRVFGTSELLAFVGGFLSLIAGVSVISFLEIFYYFGCKNMKFNKVSSDRRIAVQKSENSFEKFMKKYCNFSTIHGLDKGSEEKVFG
jgi:hypothetical protein